MTFKQNVQREHHAGEHGKVKVIMSAQMLNIYDGLFHLRQMFKSNNKTKRLKRLKGSKLKHSLGVKNESYVPFRTELGKIPKFDWQNGCKIEFK